MNIPTGHHHIMPYLMLQDANAFIDFTQKVFDATLSHCDRWEDTQLVRHAEIQVGDSTIMFSNARDVWKPEPAGLFIYVNNADHTYHLALKNGAENIMEPADQSYGRSCGVKDSNHNTWWITSVL